MKGRRSLAPLSSLQNFVSKKGCWHSVRVDNGVSVISYGHAACLDKQEMLVVGGCNDFGNFLCSFFVFDTGTFLYTPI